MLLMASCLCVYTSARRGNVPHPLLDNGSGAVCAVELKVPEEEGKNNMEAAKLRELGFG